MQFLTNPWAFGSIAFICVALVLVLLIIFHGKEGSETVLNKEGFRVINGKRKKEISSPHSACPHARDIMEIVHRTLEYSEKRQELKNSIIEEQMKFYEEVEEEAKSLMRNIFIKLLSGKLDNETSFIHNDEYASYVITLRALFSDLKVYTKNFFKSNHYAYMAAEEQIEYIEKKKFLILQKGSEALNSYWVGNLVPIDTVYKANQTYKKEFEELVGKVFNRAFLISRETYNRIEKLEREYSEYIEKTVGSNSRMSF